MRPIFCSVVKVPIFPLIQLRGIFLWEFLAKLALDVAPDLVAGIIDRREETARSFGDGLEVADQGGAVGIAGEEVLEPRIFADFAVAGGEEFGEILLELFGLEGVEV